MSKYFSLARQENKATLNIYGDITSYPWKEGDVSSVDLSKQLAEIGDVSEIDVYINSYGGEVAEGLAIYNALKRHKAKVKTHCDGFACSIASVIFMAGDERIMNDSSLLMIHNAWTFAEGNAAELRKQADDLEKITQASVTAYMAHSDLTEAEIKALMDAETWILPEEAIEYGFATKIKATVKDRTSQSAKNSLFEMVKAHRQTAEVTETEVAEEIETEESETIPEPTPSADFAGEVEDTETAASEGQATTQKMLNIFEIWSKK